MFCATCHTTKDVQWVEIPDGGEPIPLCARHVPLIVASRNIRKALGDMAQLAVKQMYFDIKRAGSWLGIRKQKQ